MSDQENRNPQHSDPQKPVPPEQKPIIQPNQPVQQKPVVPIAQPRVRAGAEHDQYRENTLRLCELDRLVRPDGSIDIEPS